VRRWLESGDARWLLLGLGGLGAVASGIALTTVMRRDVCLAATGRAAKPESTAPPRRGPIAWVEAAGKLVLHYPSHFWLFAALGRVDLFLVAYLAAHGLYLGRAGLSVLLALGRPGRVAAVPGDGGAQ
jgi:hypothetical protein